MAPSWTPDKVKKLLELLREHYDRLFVKSLSNMQRKLQKDTFEMIAEKLGMPVQALRYKYFNLNNAYNTEMKKIQAAKNQGFFYRPTLPWFNEYREIMDKVTESCNEFEAELNKKSQPVEQPEELSDTEEELVEDEEDPLPLIPQSNKIVVTIKQEFIDGARRGIKDVDFDESFEPVHDLAQIQPGQPRMDTVKKGVKRQSTPHKSIMVKPRRPISVHEDEFQMFANHVAEQLRNMTIETARKMQGEIHIIFDEEGYPFDSPVLEDMT